LADFDEILHYDTSSKSYQQLKNSNLKHPRWRMLIADLNVTAYAFCDDNLAITLTFGVLELRLCSHSYTWL